MMLYHQKKKKENDQQVQNIKTKTEPNINTVKKKKKNSCMYCITFWIAA